jgi:glycosyltransferase involved in cell wall biosynthesis
MNVPKVSVIIPSYNGAKFLRETIQSVLWQTFSNFELIIVDDASTDDTVKIINQFDDPRIKYIVHDKNRGSEIARNTGLQASTGEIITFLDQDDLFHPEKLQAHVGFLENNPDIGFTYNARFNLNYSSNTVREIWRPPRSITLADLVLSYPFSPSDVMFRREWAFRMDLIGGSLSWCGGEIVHYGRLFLDGCKFACIDRALNYRRYHSGRIIKALSGGCEAEIYAQNKIFSDLRCPAEVIALKDVAHANIYMAWAYRAFAQNDTILGQKFIREAARLRPSILDGNPCELVISFVTNSIDDESLDHAVLLESLFSQLPQEMGGLFNQFDWALARGYLMKGARAVIWNRPEDGQRHFEQAARLKASIDESYLRYLTHHLLDFETEFGGTSTQYILKTLAPYLKALGGQESVRHFIGTYTVNRAFTRYRTGKFTEVPKTVLQAVLQDPSYLSNRGVLSIFLRSIIGISSN